MTLDEFAPTLMKMAELNGLEHCGLLYAGGPIEIANVAASPHTEYAMDPGQQSDTMKRLGWPLAVWHTHPGGRREPSEVDHSSALPGVPYMIATPDGWAGAWLDGEQIGSWSR